MVGCYVSSCYSSDWTHRVIDSRDHASVMVWFEERRSNCLDQRCSSGPQDWCCYWWGWHCFHQWICPLQGSLWLLLLSCRVSLTLPCASCARICKQLSWWNPVVEVVVFVGISMSLSELIYHCWSSSFVVVSRIDVPYHISFLHASVWHFAFTEGLITFETIRSVYQTHQ